MLRWILPALCLATVSAAQDLTITAARYTDPTEKYTHAILGDAIEYEGVEATLSNGTRTKLRWPDTIVFEDVEPRLVDMDLDGKPELMVIETHVNRGARLSFYRLDGETLQAAGSIPFIGTRFRWLAPIGAADLDGDGYIEFAYVDRPHLAKTIRVWRYKRLSDDTVELTPLGNLQGYTNHRIGEPDIAGGIRDCNGAQEMIVADANWQSLFAVTFGGSDFGVEQIGPHQGRGSFQDAMRCGG